MSRKPIKRAPSRAAAAPRNTSRGAGQAAPASAAATAPASFYDPTAGQAAAGAVPSELMAASAHPARVRAQAVEEPGSGYSFDPSLHPDYEAPAASDQPRDDRVDIAADIERIRKIRRPLGAFTQKLALPVRRGYHRHWFNDVGGRVGEAIANGWSHVKDDEGKELRRVVGTGRDNGPLYAYAMEIPEVFWLEDMAARHEVARQSIDSLKSAPFRAQKGSMTAQDQGKFYNPQEENEGPLSVHKV